MKPKKLTRTLLGVVAVLTLLAALIAPVPAYANTSGGHEPPPPKPPSNDLGSGNKSGSSTRPDGKGGEATSAASSAAPGTPQGLAAQLSTGSLKPVTEDLTPPFKVEFCPQAGPDFFNGACHPESSIEDIITYIQGLDNTSGVIYVAQNYSTGATLPQPGLVFDQSTFTVSGRLVTSLDVYGGYDGTGTQTMTRTVLNQPVTVQNFNDLSQFSMDMFQFNISGYTATDPAEAAVNVLSSNHVSLTNLGIRETSLGDGVVISQSNDVTLQRLSVNDSGGGMGIVASASSKILLDHVDSTSTSATGYGAYLMNNSGTLTVSNSQFSGNNLEGLLVQHNNGDVSLDGVTAAGNAFFGVVLQSNTGTLDIRNSSFDGNGFDGIDVISQSGAINLDTVTAAENDFIGASFTSNNGPISILNSDFSGNQGPAGLKLSGNSGLVSLDGVTASENQAMGASLAGQTNGDITILNSFFDNNGTGGLLANVSGGAITLNNVSASYNSKSTGANLNSFIAAGSVDPGLQITGGNFSGNGARGMQAGSTGEIDLIGASFSSNTTDGLVLNGGNNQSAINLIGVQAISNGGIGTQVSFTGDVQVIASLFTGNAGGGLDLEYSYMPPAPGGAAPDSFTVTLDQVQAVANGDYGAVVGAGVSSNFPPVDLFITNSNFDQNTDTNRGWPGDRHFRQRLFGQRERQR